MELLCYLRRANRNISNHFTGEVLMQIMIQIFQPVVDTNNNEGTK
jgi:hypothetical protein